MYTWLLIGIEEHKKRVLPGLAQPKELPSNTHVTHVFNNIPQYIIAIEFEADWMVSKCFMQSGQSILYIYSYSQHRLF